ncbi:MAG: hypothetical protein ACP5N1_00010 [Candidatus Woesearchaeota archaeon]
MDTKMRNKKFGNRKIEKIGIYLFFTMLIIFLLSISLVVAIPAAPLVNYVSNTSYTSGLTNRSTDVKGTITTITLSANQQDYKWKAYVGNVTGRLVLDDSSGQSIYDWSTGVVAGEVYVSRFSNIDWSSIACADQTSINTEQTGLSMSLTVKDNINATFNYTTHSPFTVGTTPISGCRSTATYVNDAAQPTFSSAYFQEILLRDTVTNNLLYTGIINSSSTGYNGQSYDFQIIVGENESSSIPTRYFFWVELG